MVPARARAPVVVVREHDLCCWEHDSGCPGARFRLSGSTIQVVREHDSGCPGARFGLSGSTIQVVREHVT